MVGEFAGDLAAAGERRGPAADGEAPAPGRAAALYERIFLGYGDDSVAQLGGAHVACEWASNLLTKILQRPRLAAYLEQSTRYIAYDAPIDGGRFRYYRDPSLGPEYVAAMDALFETYAAALPIVSAWAADAFPIAAGESPAAHARAIKAKALDLLRGLLPAASLSHMGIYASGQTYEQLILHLLAHPLPEAREYGTMILRELQPVLGSFLTRVERPERGGRWIEYLGERAATGERWARRLGLDGRPGEDDTRRGPSVRLLHADGTEQDLLCALLFESTPSPRVGRARGRRAALGRGAGAMLADLVGERENRRHRPGAASRRCATGSRSSPTTAPSATCSATGCSPSSGSRSRPISAPTCLSRSPRRAPASEYRRALEISAAAYERLRDTAPPRRARTRCASATACASCST